MRRLFNWTAALIAGLAQNVVAVRTGSVVKCIVHEFSKRPHAKVMGGVCTAGIAILALVFSMAAIGLADLGALLAFPAAVMPKPKPPEKLVKLAKELFKIQEEYAGKERPAEIGKEFEAKAKEAEALQEAHDAEVKNWEVTNRLQKYLGEVPDPTLPEEKSEEKAPNGDRIAGYLSLGDAVIHSPEFQEFARKNFPRGQYHILSVPELQKGFVPLTKDQRSEWETKATPTLGTGVIDPQRLSDFVKVTEDDALTLRSVLNVSRTNSSSVEYLREDSYTRAAAPTAAEATKPEATAAYSIQSATVRTIAVWIPVTTQMLADLPNIRNLIDNRLLYDLRKEEEEQVMYGGGTGQDFAGIVPNAGHDIAVADARVTSPTIVDQVRVGITEVRVAGYMPNALVIHPIDWESVVLEKGSDSHYLAQVFPTADGTMRIWGLNVVESIAAEENAGNTTEARNLVVGDFRRGATLWIREEASVQVGMANDDFITNMRTILAEERAAFAVQAPDAFAVLETVAAVA